jgi:osmoprotectant transport system substrate-binding protein
MDNYKKAAVCLLMVLLLGMPGLVLTSEACVGRKLVIGYQNNTEQAIMAALLSILIEERTGTKVTLKEVEGPQEAHRALEANEIQIYVESTGVGLLEILGEKPDNDPKEVYKKVKSAYIKNFNLVWLKTFGYNSSNVSLDDKSMPLDAAPIVRKDTLEKFPALARLINKLHGKIDDNVIKQMVAKVDKDGAEPKNVAGEFLAKMGISFSFSPGQG